MNGSTLQPAVRTPRQARAVKTRARLLEAAERAFSELGYAATTTKEIASRAGVATGTVYQYFVDKDALLREIALSRLVDVADGSLKALEVDPPDPAASRAGEVRERMRAMVTLVMDYHRADPSLHAVLTERRHCDPELDALTSAAERALVDRIARLLDRWDYPGDVEATAFILFGLVEGSVHAHVLGGPVVEDHRFVDSLVDALIRIANPA